MPTFYATLLASDVPGGTFSSVRQGISAGDDDGAVVDAVDQPANLFLKGQSVASGYWCRAETTRQVFQG